MKMESLHDLMLDVMKDTYDAEHQITQALPQMAQAATSADLKKAFEQHLRQTEKQIEQLEQAFEMIGQRPSRKQCVAMKGLIKEGQELIEEGGDKETLDAGLIAAAQKVEHYEIAAYGTLRTWAQQLGMNDAAEIFDRIAQEEGTTDQKLTKLAEGKINQRAQ